MRKVTANTTPLIALADIGLLWILHSLYGDIYIPEAVKNEIKSEPAKSEVSSCEWIKVRRVIIDSDKRIYSTRLHTGEIETIILSEEINSDLVILDDNAAKKTAKYLGMTVTGTLGVLLRAKREGLIEAVGPYTRKLISDGMYISDKVLRQVLENSGEL